MMMGKHGWRAVAAIAAAVLLLGASAPESAAGLDALRLDQLRVLGSHNSYRPYPSPALEARIRTLAPEEWDGLAYGHPPLETQLALGLRQFEIDVAPDPQGGAYAAPYADATPAIRAEMAAPGAKVVHIPGFDWQTHCRDVRACLSILRRWSDDHPRHLPLTILINASDVHPVSGLHDIEQTFDAAALDALDADIAAVIGRARIITPDDVRGAAPTLRAAVLAHRWPTIGAARGKFLFVLDSSEEAETRYRAGHASLRGRMMFGWYPEDAPEAAWFNVQDPVAEGARIARLVRAGFMVRTRADADTVEARRRDHARLRAAIASGAQIISTDYYAGAPDPLGLGFQVALPGGMVACNSVTARCARR